MVQRERTSRVRIRKPSASIVAMARGREREDVEERDDEDADKDGDSVNEGSDKVRFLARRQMFNVYVSIFNTGVISSSNREGRTTREKLKSPWNP